MVRPSVGRVALVIALAALAGCGSGNGAPVSPTTTVAPRTTVAPAITTAPGLANPASVYCESRGGKVEIVTNPDGQQGMCVLPDGTRVDEWDFYRSNHPTSTTEQPSP